MSITNRKGIILCVDDEPGVLATLKEQLLADFMSTHDVVTATSGGSVMKSPLLASYVQNARADEQIAIAL